MNKRLLLSCTVFLILVTLGAIPVLAATVNCPSSCSCLLPAEAAKINTPGLCGGKQLVCAVDAKNNEKYCYTKPVTTTTVPVACPSSCSCYTLEDGKQQGLGLCNNKMTLCGYGENQRPKYCHTKPVTVKTTTPATSDCPSGCSCYTLADGKQQGLGLCGNKMTLCGYGANQQPKYCHQKPVTITTTTPVPAACPSGCSCYTLADGKQLGLGLCNNKMTLCGYAANQQPEYCHQPPVTIVTLTAVNVTRRIVSPVRPVVPVIPPAGPRVTTPLLEVDCIPEIPVPGDEISCDVTIGQGSGIGRIDIWTDGRLSRTCLAANCQYTTPPIDEEPEITVVGIASAGDLVIEGNSGVRDNYASMDLGGTDSDGDGTSDWRDNCPAIPNPDQLDTDRDSVGDLCDQCCPACDTSMTGTGREYCCAQTDSFGYGNPYTCWDSLTREGDDGRDVWYWQDFYTTIADDGCGCYDSDDGVNNPYSIGSVSDETVEGGNCATPVYDEMGRPHGGGCSLLRSDCSSPRGDVCVNSSTVREYSCSGSGIEHTEITCPYGCSIGTCTCPDTDGGRYDYYTAGSIDGHYDYCEGATVVEQYCRWSEMSGFLIREDRHYCPNGCREGACIHCIDTDGGATAYSRRGTAAGYEDTCIDDFTLQEYFVVPGEGTCDVYSVNVTCLGCRHGACTPSCSDGLQNLDETGIDCGGSCPASCTDCFADAGFGSGDESDRFSFGSDAVERASSEALMEYADCLQNRTCRRELPTVVILPDYSSVTATDLETSPDSIMEAVGYYVDQHMQYTYDDLWGSGAPNIQDASYTIEESSSRCSMDYCGDCEDHAILRHALLRQLGVSSYCAYLADYIEGGYWGTGGHTFNIVNYRNKYRIMDYHPLGYYFDSRWYAHVTDTLWNDRVGEYWCAEWKDNVAGAGGCDKVSPTSYTWNYADGDHCPDPWSGQETFQTDVCP